MQKKFPPFTLTNDEISSARVVSRRSLLGSLGVGLGLAAAGVVANAGAARAQSGPTGCTDHDRGRHEDPLRGGRRCRSTRYTGCTDRDMGFNEDPPEHGIGCWV